MKGQVLIFGINSFTGVHLSQYLQRRGYSVYGTDKGSCDITQKGEIWEILRRVKPNYILNFSAISSPIYGDSLEFYRVNTMGAINILEVLEELKLNPQKIILPSSAIVYGKQQTEILDETLPPQPTNHYGTSKYSMENLAQNHFQHLNIILTRPFNYTGRGHTSNFLIPKIVNHFRDGKKSIELGNLDIVREFNDIGFVCEVYRKLLESDIRGEVLNICSGRGIELMEIIQIMNEIANYTIKVEINPKFIRKADFKRLIGSPKKLFSIVGELKQPPFEETLRSMYEG